MAPQTVRWRKWNKVSLSCLILRSSPYIPSTLASPTRESVSEHLFRHRNIKPFDKVGEQVLRRAINFNREESIELEPEDMAFGQAALNRYLEDPRDIYYVKSPKSFLGASGLRDVQLSFFEDLVCAMMDNIKSQAESDAQQIITDAVIGRPINFHGRGGETANIQAEGILLRAAKRAGFQNVEFQFEPVAAGLEYEATLTEDKTILVVDIGGGTTDCSLIQMGYLGVVKRIAQQVCWRTVASVSVVTIWILHWRSNN